MIAEKREKQILRLSFFSELLFAAVEYIFSIYSHSQSALTDAVYDASELVFIALLLFLTPLFHKPVSEKHPYGYFQVESIFENSDAWKLNLTALERCKTPNMEGYQDFLKGEVRYASLAMKNPERAAELFAHNEQEAKERFEHLSKLVALYGNE